MSKFKTFKSIKETKYNGHKYTVLVYGEVNEVNEMTGFYTVPVVFNGKTNKPIAIDYDRRFITPSYKQFYGKTKVFNMGWAICSECDTFDLETGIKICRRRFNRSPITTQNGRFLTPDMCSAIVENEANYVVNHIEMFLPKKWETNDDDSNNGTNVKDDKYKVNLKFVNELTNKNNPVSNKNFDENRNLITDVFSLFNDPYSLKNDIKISFDNGHGIDAKGAEFELELEDNITFDDGEYVYFKINNVPYVGIFTDEVVDKESGNWLRDNYYFYAPIDENGLVKHNEARFFSSIDGMYDVIDCANDDAIRLINDYLKGAHSKAWDNNKKRFKIVF